MLSLIVKDGHKVIFAFRGKGLSELMRQLVEVSVEMLFIATLKKVLAQRCVETLKQAELLKNVQKQTV